MSVLRRAKLRTPDGTESIEYPLGVEAENVEVANGENLSQRLVRIDEDLEKNEEDIAAVSELAGRNRQNIGANEIRIDALERRNASIDKKPYYYNSVADMKADNKLKVGDMAVTLGYYEPNDGGGAKYNIISTKLETDYVEDLSNNNYALLILDKWINIKQIGCKSDDETFDNSLKLLNIINNFNNIFIPSGNFYIYNRIEIIGKNDLTLAGEEKSIIIFPNMSMETVTSLQGVLRFSNSNNITIKNIKLSCGGDWLYRPYLWDSSYQNDYYPKRYSTFNGLVIDHSNDVFIDNIEIYKSQVGIYLSFVERGKIVNSLVRDTLADSYRIGAGSKYINVENCSCYNCGDDSYVANNEHGSYATKEYEPFMINFYNCTAYDCFGSLICMLSANDCHAYNCQAVNNRDYPIKLGQSSLNISSYNCSIENCKVVTSKRVEGNTYSSENNNINGGIVQIGDSGNGTNHNLSLKNCYFEQSNGDNKAFELSSQSGYTIENCKFNGYSLLMVSNATNNIIKNCEFIGHDGSLINGCTNNDITNVKIINDTTYSTRTKRGLAIINSTDLLLNNIKVDGTTENQTVAFFSGSQISEPNIVFYITNLKGEQKDIPITGYLNLECNHVIEFENSMPDYPIYKLGQLARYNDELYIRTSNKWGLVTIS